MNKIIALTAVLLLLTGANAATPTTSSSGVTETKIKDEGLEKQLESEVATEAPVQKQATKAAAKPVVIKNNTPNTDINGELTLDDEQEARVEKELAGMQAQESVSVVEKPAKSRENNMYVSAMVGMGAYPEVGNISGSYAAGMALGYHFNKDFMFEIGAGISQYNMDALNPTIFNRRDNFDINQYNAQLGAKYRIMQGRIVPLVGALISYTYRQFTLTNPMNSPNTTIDSGNSQTTDAGLSAGVDYEFTKEFAVGVDLKYMFNVANSAGSNVNTSVNGVSSTPIDKLQHYSAGVSARMNF